MNLLTNPLTFWLVTGRLSGFIAFCPGFNADELPAPRAFKALLVVWLAVWVLPSVTGSTALVRTIPDMGIAMGCEFLLGMGSALCLRLIFTAVRLGGTLIDSELSFLAAEQFNPTVTISGGVMNRFLGLAGLFYFWMLDYATLLLYALAKSFSFVPLGSLQAGVSQSNYELLVRMGSNAFVGGLMIAAPILALNFFLSVGVAFLARLVQGINIFYESFSLRILIGSAGVIFFLPLILMAVRIQMEKMLHTFSAFLQGSS